MTPAFTRNTDLLLYLLHAITDTLQGGEDPQDALSRRSFSAKEPLIIGLFCGQ